jgi:amino acid transporter
MSQGSTEKIGIKTAIIIGMNAMIGAGIFGITSLLGSQVGPAGILTYLFAISAVWFIAQSFARVAYLYPQEGSFYHYSKQWAGHTVGAIAAGAYLIGLLIAMGLLCTICGMYLHNMMPNYSATFLGLCILASLIALNMVGMALSKIGQYILIGLTLYPLIVTTALCLTKINIANLTPFMPYGPLSVITGTRVAIFGLFGFESIASLFSIVKNPEKNVPAALRYTIIYVGIIYFIFIMSMLLAIPQEIFIDNPRITIPQILEYLFPSQRLLTESVGISILFAIMGTIHAMIWASSTLMMSYFKVLNISPLKRAIAHNKIGHKTCVLVAGLIILIAFLSVSNLNMFFSLTAVPLIFAFITSIIPLLTLKSEWESGQNYLTIIGLISALIIFAVAVEELVKNLITCVR